MDGPTVAILAPLRGWGGLERSFAILCQELVRAGVVPEIVQLRGGGLPYPASLPSQVRSVDLETHSKRDGIPKVARYLKHHPPAAVVTAKDHAAQVALLARYCARVAVPVFVSATNMPSVVIRRSFQRAMARRLYRNADGIIAVSRGVADDVTQTLRVPEQRVHVIYNPVITRDFEARCRANIESQWLDEGSQTPVIVSAGRFTGQKDFVTLIDAFAQLRTLRPARLLLLGEGEDRAQLEARVAAHGLAADIALPGHVSDPVAYMRQAALFAFASRYEGLGNVLVEALASGTRIVATDCPSGPREILADGRYGRLVPMGDAEALASAMGAALDEPRPAAADVEAACRPFTAPVVAHQYLRLLGLADDGLTGAEGR